MAQLAECRWPAHRPDQRRGARNQRNPEFPSPDCECLECGRDRSHGVTAVPCLLPVLRGGRAALLSTLPAQRRHFPWCAVQYRLLCPAHTDGGAGDRTQTRRFHSYPRRCASLQQPLRTGAATEGRTNVSLRFSACCFTNTPLRKSSTPSPGNEIESVGVAHGSKFRKVPS